MRGIIKYVVKDNLYRFRGSISGEDGHDYKFNSRNWFRNDLELSDLCEGQDVEFDLKPRNKNGNIYPKLIHFPGENGELKPHRSFSQVNHSYGRFNDFVYIKTDDVMLALEEIVDDFCNSEYATSTDNLYKKIATTFNELHDNDFIFSDSNDTVTFPIGFSSKDGHPVLMNCTVNKENNAPWYADSVSANGKIYGKNVFSIINANWYDIEDAINTIIPTNKDNTFDIIQRIKKRCRDLEKSIVYLKEGCVCSCDNADELYAPTGYFEKNGKEVYLLCALRLGPRGYGWYFSTATHENASITIFEKKTWFEKWSGSLNKDVFEKLAAQTLEEQWSFGNKTDYGILRNYIKYTFSYQLLNDNIGYSSDKRYAAFNTGLPDRNSYKYLYALFEKKEDNSSQIIHPLFYQQQYTFLSFVVSGRGEGKVLSQNIQPLPNPPQYFEARSATVWELDFNRSNQITIPEYDDTHILIHRCERIPLSFYKSHSVKSERLSQILELSKPLPEKYKLIREFFKPIVDNEPDNEVTDVYRELHDALNTVISQAVKKLSWNWRAVVPCFNPERNEMCFLLPVSFCDHQKPDRAMIASVNRIENNIYTIHTVIPLDWAYLDARLVCRPESEWLAANYIKEEE